VSPRIGSRIMDVVSENAPVAREDRSKWRYEDEGAAFVAATEFRDLLLSPDVAARLEEVKSMVTASSWPAWESGIRAGLPIP
jgi:hypothetical protein